MANDQFVWAFSLALVGLIFPVLLQAVSHKERLAEAKKEKPILAVRHDYSLVLAVSYLGMAYGLGLLFAMTPMIYIDKIRGLTEVEKMQARTLSPGHRLLCLEQTSE